MSKYGHKPHHWFEAIVNKLGGEERADAFLRDELSVCEPTRSWREEDGVIYFSVTSDGTTGEDWIERLSRTDVRIGVHAKQMLRSPDFKPTNGMTTEVAVLKGMLFNAQNRTTKNIRSKAKKRKLSNPNAELACLIREQFTDNEIEAMGLENIMTMHEPLPTFCRDLNLLFAGRYSVLNACTGMPDAKWQVGSGFAFAVSQVSSHT